MLIYVKIMNITSFAHRYRGLGDDEDHDGPGVEEFVQQQRQRGHSPAESNR